VLLHRSFVGKKKLEELGLVVRQLMHQLFLPLSARVAEKKGTLEGQERKYIN
jgi:hypothetical protein